MKLVSDLICMLHMVFYDIFLILSLLCCYLNNLLLRRVMGASTLYYSMK